MLEKDTIQHAEEKWKIENPCARYNENTIMVQMFTHKTIFKETTYDLNLRYLSQLLCETAPTVTSLLPSHFYGIAQNDPFTCTHYLGCVRNKLLSEM